MYYIYGDIDENCSSSHRSSVFLHWIESQKLILYVGNLYLYSCGVITFYSHMVKEDTTNL